ncbi:MAG: FAD-dependent thymidylate synthase [Nanoarchaeota archaeon]
MRRIILSGYNVDVDVLNELKRSHSGFFPALGMAFGQIFNRGKYRKLLAATTPEVLSAGYAYASRDATSMDGLRAEARNEVAKARGSNKNIVFKMGHSSVAEHAELNFDFMGISRLAVEFLEQHRLCSYTEKSQRYITLKGDFVLPQELNGPFMAHRKERFLGLIRRQNDFYFKSLEPLLEYQKAQHPEKAGNKDGMKTIEGWAKEDARYSLSLATEAQLGFTGNTRNLEKIIRQFKHHPLAEIREIGEELYQEAVKVVPSLIILADKKLFTDTTGTTLDNSFVKYGEIDARDATKSLLAKWSTEGTLDRSKIKKHGSLLVECDDVDRNVVSALWARYEGIPLGEAMNLYDRMITQPERREEIVKYVKDCLQHLSLHDALPREFEKGVFTFDLEISSTGYAQLKRHRMCTQIVGEYDPQLGITVPPAIQAIGKEAELKEVAERTNDLFYKLRAAFPENHQVADYCLTNAHKRRVQVEMNARELYHFSRLREDGHAQWDIRNLAHLMVDAAKQDAPITTMLLAGKDQFNQVRKDVYGG